MCGGTVIKIDEIMCGARASCMERERKQKSTSHGRIRGSRPYGGNGLRDRGRHIPPLRSDGLSTPSPPTREYRAARHHPQIKVQRDISSRLKTLRVTRNFSLNASCRLNKFTQPTSIHSTTSSTSFACNRNCSPSIRTRITFFRLV